MLKKHGDAGIRDPEPSLLSINRAYKYVLVLRDLQYRNSFTKAFLE